MENRQNNYQQAPRHVVCLKNIPRNMVKDDIQNLCASFGRVENINDTKAPYMFVRMATLNDFESVIQGLKNNQHGIVAEAARKAGGGSGNSNSNNTNNTNNNNYNGNTNHINDHTTKRHNDYNQRQNDFNQRQNDFNQGLKNTSFGSSSNNRTSQNYSNRSQFQNSQDRNSFDNNMKKESSTTSENKPSISSKGQCRICRKASHLVCQRCGEFYCSSECQCVDWPGHKYICIPMPKLIDLNSPEVGVIPGIPADLPILNDIVPGKDNNHMQKLLKTNESPENTKNTVVVTNDTSSQKRPYQQERQSSSFPNKLNNSTKPIANREENITPPRKDYNSTKISPNKRENIKPSPNKDNNITNNNANDGPKMQKPKEMPIESVNTSNNEVTKPIKNFPKSGTTVSLTFLCKSNHAYIRPLGKEENDIYLDVLNKINIEGETAKKLGNMPKVGDIIITNFQDMGFYRAKVLSVENEENIAVTYLDFGNTEMKKFPELKEMPNDLMCLDRCIYPVILKNVPDFSVNDVLLKFINTYVDNLVELKLTYETTANNIEVELFDLSTNTCLNKKILEFNKSTGKTVSDDSPVMMKDITVKDLPNGKNVPLFVTDNSLLETSLLSCVHESDLGMVDKYNQEFDVYARKVKEPHTPRLSEVCLVQFDEDQVWYRAECIELDDKENPSVVFIDFGNFTNVNVSKIRKYPKELIRPCHTSCCVIADLPDELNDKVAERLKQLLPANEKIIVDKVETLASNQTSVLYIKKVVDILKSENLI